MISVVNKHKAVATKEDVYVGRGSALGNPFEIDVDGTRDEVVAMYKVWLEKKLKFKDAKIRKAMNEIWSKAKKGNVRLACYCAPLRCHAEIIREIVESKL